MQDKLGKTGPDLPQRANKKLLQNFVKKTPQIFGSVGKKKALNYLLGLLEEGHLSIEIDQDYPMTNWQTQYRCSITPAGLNKLPQAIANAWKANDGELREKEGIIVANPPECKCEPKLSRNSNHLTPGMLAEISKRNLNIWVGMPCTYEVTMDWVTEMRVPLSRISWCDITAITYRGYSVDAQRNTIVEHFLANASATHLLWVDTDNIPETPPQPDKALARLVLRDVPIVSGVYRLKGEGFPLSFKEFSKSRSTLLTSKQELFEVQYTALGFCLVKREVFEKISPPWFACKKTSFGEDTYFSLRARESGYKVMVDPTIRLDHIGFFTLKSDGSFGLLSKQ